MLLYSIFSIILIVSSSISALPSKIKGTPVASDNNDGPVVVLNNGGSVRGVKAVADNGRILHKYYSIRYANAERFRHATMVKPWNDTYDATYVREACPQFDPTEKMSEDCLFLNIIRPVDDEDIDDPDNNDNEKKLKPVMFWIFGGGFNFGSIDGIASILYDGSNIASIGDVIFIDVNYRVGALGYLYAGTDSAPGNMGVYDLIVALRWVKENIEKFGGDPNRITIFGESAGSFTVSMFLMSNMTRGLYQRAIMQSGSLNNLLQFSPEESLEKTRKYARACGCERDDPEEMVECLRDAPLSSLILNENPLDFARLIEGTDPIVMWGDKAGIVPGRPSRILNQGNFADVDLMFGFVNNEMAQMVVLFEPEILIPGLVVTHEQLMKKLRGIFNQFLFYEKERQDKIINQYIPERRLFYTMYDIRPWTVQLLSDPVMICPTYLFGQGVAKGMAANNSTKKVFGFRFEKHSPFMNLLGCLKWMGVCHGMDVPYTFGLPLRKGIVHLIFTEHDRQIAKNVIEAWSRFAYNGDPERMGDVEWQPFLGNDGQSTNQMAISEQPFMFRGQYHKRCEQTWKKYLFP